MAFPAIQYQTKLPQKIIDILEEDLSNYNSKQINSSLFHNKSNKNIRNSNHCWIPTTHWIGEFVWGYIQRANRDNFLYDITCIDGECIQYTSYEQGQFYGWHVDGNILGYNAPEVVPSSSPSNMMEVVNTIGAEKQYVRKLSFTLQLSDEEDYTGGEFQFINDNRESFFASKEKGSLIVFDSRMMHRVKKVKSGVRKSLVGWAIGPRWK
jgi:hypothetical protein